MSMDWNLTLITFVTPPSENAVGSVCRLTLKRLAREVFLNNPVFDSLDTLEDQLALGLRALEKNPETVRTVVSWDWIVSSLITSFMK